MASCLDGPSGFEEKPYFKVDTQKGENQEIKAALQQLNKVNQEGVTKKQKRPFLTISQLKKLAEQMVKFKKSSISFAPFKKVLTKAPSCDSLDKNGDIDLTYQPFVSPIEFFLKHRMEGSFTTRKVEFNTPWSEATNNQFEAYLKIFNSAGSDKYTTFPLKPKTRWTPSGIPKDFEGIRVPFKEKSKNVLEFFKELKAQVLAQLEVNWKEASSNKQQFLSYQLSTDVLAEILAQNPGVDPQIFKKRTLEIIHMIFDHAEKKGWDLKMVFLLGYQIVKEDLMLPGEWSDLIKPKYKAEDIKKSLFSKEGKAVCSTLNTNLAKAFREHDLKIDAKDYKLDPFRSFNPLRFGKVQEGHLQGERQEYEDATRVELNSALGTFFITCDGHSDKGRVARFVADNFVSVFTHCLNTFGPKDIGLVMEATMGVLQELALNDRASLGWSGGTTVLATYVPKDTNIVLTATLGDSEAVALFPDGHVIPLSNCRNWGIEHSTTDVFRALKVMGAKILPEKSTHHQYPNGKRVKKKEEAFLIGTDRFGKRWYYQFDNGKSLCWFDENNEEQPFHTAHPKYRRFPGGFDPKGYKGGLNVSRSIELEHKSRMIDGKEVRGVSQKPKVTGCMLPPGTTIIQGCDGLFDVATLQTIESYAKENELDPQKMCVWAVNDLESTDNVSLIVAPTKKE